MSRRMEYVMGPIDRFAVLNHRVVAGGYRDGAAEYLVRSLHLVHAQVTRHYKMFVL
jgi:hypothetical protein